MRLLWRLSAVVLTSSTIQAEAGKSSTMDKLRWTAPAPEAPPFKVPADPAEWRRRQPELRAEMERLLGRLPPRPGSPKVVTDLREDHGTFWAEKFRLDNGAGEELPGWLLIPKNLSARAPAILWNHWHGGEYAVGKSELFQNKHTPEAPGPALAARGYVVMAVDAPGFGERNGVNPDGEINSSGEMSRAKYELWLGRTYWGMLLRDDRIALDYLASRPETDPTRIGAAGISMGATRTWWLMALDERIKAGVAVACLTRYHDLIANRGLFHHGIYYYVPGMLEHFDTEAVVACAAPRALLCMTGDQDAGSPPSGVLAIAAAAKSAWECLGRPSEFESILYAGVGHAWTPDMWTKAGNWLDQHLHPQSPK
jgi:dienelactone hydrolase